MQNKLVIFIVCSVIIWPSILAYGESYQIKIDKHIYEITYDLDGNVIAMVVDHELTSLLIGTEDVKNSLFEIELPNEMIIAENNEFAVLVNGFEVNYEIISIDSNSKLTFFVPADTEEIEIIGTYVIPEFPFGIILVFVVLTTLVLVFSKSKTGLFR